MLASQPSLRKQLNKQWTSDDSAIAGVETLIQKLHLSRQLASLIEKRKIDPGKPGTGETLHVHQNNQHLQEYTMNFSTNDYT